MEDTKQLSMIDLKTIITARSKLTVIERLPFDIKRVYYLHGIDPHVPRAGHAHKGLQRLIVAVSGSCSARLDGDPITLDDPTKGLFVDPLQWLEFDYFSADAVLLVLASREHDESDCIRDRNELEEMKLDFTDSALLGATRSGK
jgi:hypothetical protein